MGLDMYLTKKTYVKSWDHMRPEEKHTVTVTGPDAKSIKPERIAYVEEEVGYWRKANEIHAWFVNNVQNGVDDCGIYWVGDDQLRSLYDLCIMLLESKDVDEAMELLPTQPGFFFGGTDIDEYYWEDLQLTVDQLKPLLAETGEFYYHSSW